MTASMRRLASACALVIDASVTSTPMVMRATLGCARTMPEPTTLMPGSAEPGGTGTVCAEPIGAATASTATPSAAMPRTGRTRDNTTDLLLKWDGDPRAAQPMANHERAEQHEDREHTCDHRGGAQRRGRIDHGERSGAGYRCRGRLRHGCGRERWQRLNARGSRGLIRRVARRGLGLRFGC